MKDYIVGATALDGAVRAFASNTTFITREARKIHELAPVASAALGRTLTAAAILSSVWLKNDTDTLTVQINGGGPLGRVIVVSDAFSNVRGYVEYPSVETRLNKLGKLDVAWGVGTTGYMNIIRDLGLKEPYVGFVNLVSGEIAEDLAYFFASSEQVPTVVSLGVLVDTDESIVCSGGFILQLMPGADEKVISFLEDRVGATPHVTKMIASGKSPEEILEFIFDKKDLQFNLKRPCSFRCPCSKEKMEKNLVALGRKEISDIIEEQGEAELVCHFCNSKYFFSKENLEDILVKNV